MTQVSHMLRRLLFVLFLNALLVAGCADKKKPEKNSSTAVIGYASVIGVNETTLVIFNPVDIEELPDRHRLLSIKATGDKGHVREAEIVFKHAVAHYKMRKPKSGMAVPLIYRIDFEIIDGERMVWSGDEVTAIQVVASEDEVLSCERDTAGKND